MPAAQESLPAPPCSCLIRQATARRREGRFRRITVRIELFGSRLSPVVEKTVRALHRKALPFTLVPPRSPADFRRWNPRTRKMPVLDVDGARTFDSSLILRRLDELVPTPPLFDRDARIAARQRFVEDWSDEALYWYGMGLRWSDANAAATVAQIVGDIGAPGERDPAPGSG